MPAYSDDRIKELEVYADSFNDGTISEKILSEHLKEALRQIKSTRFREVVSE